MGCFFLFRSAEGYLSLFLEGEGILWKKRSHRCFKDILCFQFSSFLDTFSESLRRWCGWGCARLRERQREIETLLVRMCCGNEHARVLVCLRLCWSMSVWKWKSESTCPCVCVIGSAGERERERERERMVLFVLSSWSADVPSELVKNRFIFWNTIFPQASEHVLSVDLSLITSSIIVEKAC